MAAVAYGALKSFMTWRTRAAVIRPMLAGSFATNTACNFQGTAQQLINPGYVWDMYRGMATVPVHPPPDASRAATADLCDVHVPDPVDVTIERKVQIAQPIFR